MKIIGWLAAGVVVGFLLGAIPGRRDVAARDRTIARLERDARRRGNRGGGFALPGFDRILTAPAPADRPPSRPAPVPGQAVPGASPDAPRRPEAEPGPARDPDEGDGEPRGDGAPSLREFDTLVAAQRIRASQSRAALQEQAGLDDHQMQAVDRIVSHLNEQLLQYGDELMQVVVSGDAPLARDMLGVTHDVTGVMYEGQLALEAVVGADVMETVDESSGQIWNYVDLAQFRPFVEQAQ